jgi:hypothetical protein
VYVAVVGSPATRAADSRAEPALGAIAQVAPTDLPAARAVTPAANIPAARNDARKADKSPPQTSRAVIIDPQTDVVVFRSLEASTGRVIDQVPGQALLRRRAYEDAQAVQALIKGKKLSPAQLATAADIDATA